MKNILSRKGKMASRKSSRKKLSQDNLRRVIVNKNLKGKDAVECVESSQYVITVPINALKNKPNANNLDSDKIVNSACS